MKKVAGYSLSWFQKHDKQTLGYVGPVFIDGNQGYEQAPLKDRKEYCNSDFDTMYVEIKRKENPHEYIVDLTKKLLDLKKQMIVDSKMERKLVK